MSNITDNQIHAMCNYILGHCNKCPREIDTVYGRGTQGCFAIAEETLTKAREIAAPVLSEEQREALGAGANALDAGAKGHEDRVERLSERWSGSEKPMAGEITAKTLRAQAALLLAMAAK